MPIYRNQVVPLEPTNGACERYSRDLWIVEHDRPKDPPADPTPIVRPPTDPAVTQRVAGRTATGKAIPFRPEDMPATRGLYDLVRVEPHEAADREGSYVVVGKCRGPKCNGRLRRFSLYEWAGRGQGLNTLENGCNRCTSSRRSYNVS
jgi:hypothetical protein